MSKSLVHSSETERASAGAYVRAWSERATVLESERLHELRTLSELDAARRFVLLQGHTAPQPKPTSGLVEQQRILNLLRKTSV